MAWRDGRAGGPRALLWRDMRIVGTCALMQRCGRAQRCRRHAGTSAITCAMQMGAGGATTITRRAGGVLLRCGYVPCRCPARCREHTPSRRAGGRLERGRLCMLPTACARWRDGVCGTPTTSRCVAAAAQSRTVWQKARLHRPAGATLVARQYRYSGAHAAARDCGGWRNGGGKSGMCNGRGDDSPCALYGAGMLRAARAALVGAGARLGSPAQGWGGVGRGERAGVRPQCSRTFTYHNTYHSALLMRTARW